MLTQVWNAATTFVKGVLLPLLLLVGFRVVVAVGLWFVGRWVIRRLGSLLNKGMHLRGIDPTMQRYASSAAETALIGGLFLAIIGFVGIETASIAALLAGAGLAIGTAWGELLKNFAAGVFLVFFRPFQIGDLITAAGVTGVVQEIGIFITTVHTQENVRVFIGNNKLFTDNITNQSSNTARRLELVVTVPTDADTDLDAVMERLREAVTKVAKVRDDPPPSVAITGVSATSVTVAVRPYCHARDVESVSAASWRELKRALTPIKPKEA